MTRARGAELYPRAAAAARRALEERGGPRERAAPPLVSGRLGPGILRPPPQVQRPSPREQPGLDKHDPLDASGAAPTEELLGELVDMVFVSADEARSGHHEVHLVFKADVLGGLHLRLEKTPDGMNATFIVEDAAARRAIVDHADGILRHLGERGFRVVAHEIRVASEAGPRAPDPP